MPTWTQTKTSLASTCEHNLNHTQRQTKQQPCRPRPGQTITALCETLRKILKSSPFMHFNTKLTQPCRLRPHLGLHIPPLCVRTYSMDVP